MYAGLTLVTPPTGEPVSVADVTLHSRITTSADASMVAGYISASRRLIEGQAAIALMPQSWRYALRHWPGRSYTNVARNFSTLAEYYKFNYIEIPRPPLQSITTFTYMDVNGNLFNMQQGYANTEGNYLLDLDSQPGRIFLPYSGIWPTTVLLPMDPIQIVFVAGYSAFAGTVNVDASGLLVSWASGSLFDPTMAGSFMQIGGASCSVQTVTDANDIVLAVKTTPNQTGVPYTANSVPQNYKQAIILLAADMYQNREATLIDSMPTDMPYGVKALLDLDRNFHPIGQGF